MWVRGIDVSHYQGAVQWPQVARTGVAFSFVKATEGMYVVDPFFKDNWAGCAAAGLTRGAYHFGRPGSDAPTQAEQFFGTVKTLGVNDLPPVLDIETLDQRRPAYVLQWVLDFTDAADKLFGRRTMIYTDGGFWKNLAPLPGCEQLGKRRLWLADYAEHPCVPAPWQDWACWQYSNGAVNGGTRIHGVAGDVDQNWFEPAAFQALTTPPTSFSQGLP
jgi:lysozyme